MLHPFLIHPAVRHYSWGDPTFLPTFLGVATEGRPWAELWWGAHPDLPARAERLGAPLSEGQPLDELCAQHGAALLGEQTSERFGGLPYLVKLLAAAQPLSIQVHPSRAQARQGFDREESLTLPAGSPDRNYRDANHKPEILVALTPFLALAGFRNPESLRQQLTQVPELQAMLPRFEGTAASLRQILEAYYRLTDEQRTPALLAWLNRLAASSDPELRTLQRQVLDADRIFRVEERPDSGLLWFLLLNLIELAPRQGLFIPAGLPHAYLHGAGVELMASSDNVLRGGLTLKHVDTAEFLRIVDIRLADVPRELGTSVLSGEATEVVYSTPAQEFELRYLDLYPARPWTHQACGPETLVVLDLGDGQIWLETEERTLPLPRGTGYLLPHGTPYRLRYDGLTGRATVALSVVPAATTAASL